MTQSLRRGLPVIVALWPLVLFAGEPRDDAPAPPEKDEITNSIGMKLKLIKAGKFLMGSPIDEKYRRDLERPQHEVEIARPFYLGVHPVTRGQFAAFVKDIGYQTEAEQDGDNKTWRGPGFDQTDDDPVVCVSWNDAGRFCDWLSQKEKKAYRLPTEAEWEYACRAGTKTAYFIGDDPKDIGDYAWHGKNSQDHTHPVGGKKPNPWGLYDMMGNVSQWCLEKFALYPLSDPHDPQQGNEAGAREFEGALLGGGNTRVIRGHSFKSSSASFRSASRFAAGLSERGFGIGFRVCLIAD